MSIIETYIAQLRDTLSQLPIDDIDAVVDTLYNAWKNRRQVFIMGNGGSASTASHFVCDLAKNTRVPGHLPFRVVGLTDNMALMTAYANDEGYENVFAQQLAALLQPHDIVIGISTSGNSPNVLKAIELANSRDAITVGFTGFDGGKLGPISQHHIFIENDCIEQVEDIHLMLEHMICMDLRQRLVALVPAFASIA